MRTNSLKHVEVDNRSSLMTRHLLDGPWLKSRQRKEIFLFFKTSKPTLGPNQPPIQWVRCFGRDVHTPEYRSEVRTECSYVCVKILPFYLSLLLQSCVCVCVCVCVCGYYVIEIVQEVHLLVP